MQLRFIGVSFCLMLFNQMLCAEKILLFQFNHHRQKQITELLTHPAVCAKRDAIHAPYFRHWYTAIGSVSRMQQEEQILRQQLHLYADYITKNYGTDEQQKNLEAILGSYELYKCVHKFEAACLSKYYCNMRNLRYQNNDYADVLSYFGMVASPSQDVKNRESLESDAKAAKESDTHTQDAAVSSSRKSFFSRLFSRIHRV